MSTSSSCDIVIPFQEQHNVLSNETQSPLSLVLFSLPQEGRTALILASHKGYVNVVELLLAAGADFNHQDEVRNLVIVG